MEKQKRVILRKTWIQPLQLGSLQLENNLIQAPLAGISCSAFRRITHELSAPAFCCTEMLSSSNMRQSNQRLRYTHTSPHEGLLCFQISGHTLYDIGEATTISNEMNADLIDLNCGCPMKKIRTKGAGSKLLSQTKQLGEMVATMRAKTDKTLSIKIRVAGDKNDSCHKEVAKTAEAEGADFITVHGRHWQDDYDVAARLGQIAEVVSAVSIPVIGNGDISDYESMVSMFENTGCNGVMVARASIGQPWLFSELKARDAGEVFTPPTPTEIGQFFLRHLTYLREIESERQVVLQARRLTKHYAKHIPIDASLLAPANEFHNLKDLTDWIDQTFRN